MHDFRISVTERQIYILQAALDLFARLLIGQIEQALWSIYVSRDIDRDEFDEACRQLKTVVFPGLPQNASERPKNQKGEDWQIAFEMHGVARHELWKRQKNAPRHVVAADMPLHYSNEPFIHFEELTAKENLPEMFYSTVLSIIEGATRGDLEKVKNYTNQLAERIEATGNESTAQRFKKAARGDFGATIKPMEVTGDGS